jgi:hypothetical protein
MTQAIQGELVLVAVTIGRVKQVQGRPACGLKLGDDLL